jgi:alkanesulfonate monooxygenase SsuD/methylene tetrahydromethanopterin reductase-like flavin-dependent oxidoreductase (luciferase family)
MIVAAAVRYRRVRTQLCYLVKITQQMCALLNEAALRTAAQQAMGWLPAHPRHPEAYRVT